MAKGQIVSDLIVRLQAQGGQEVEYLRKELGQLQKVGKLTEEQLKSQVIAVKSLGKATAGTTSGLKAQIAAFEKIRGNARNTSNVYRDLTNDIRGLNRELKKQIDLEGGVSGKSGGILGFLSGTKARKLKPSKVAREDTLSYLLGTQYFGGGKGSERLVGTLDEFTRRLDKLQRGFRELSWDDLEPGDQGYLRQFQLGPGKGGLSKAAFGKTERALRHDALKAGFELDSQGLLNKYQLQALGRQDQSLDITGKPYLDLVTKITGEQQTQNHLLGQVNDRSAEELATQRARTRQIAEQNKLNVTHIKSKIHQDYVRGLELDSRKNRRTSPATMFGMRGRDDSPETKRWKGIDGFFRATSLVADELLGIKGTKLTEDLDRFRFSKGEVSKYWKPGAITGKLFTQRKGDQAKSLTELFRGQALDNLGIPVAPRGLGPSKTSAKRQILGPGMKLLDPDPYGLGGPRQYDKSPLGIGRKVQDLQQDLMALNPENKEWLQVTEEITAAEKELQAIVDKGTKRLKERRQEIGQKVAAQSKNVYGQKLLPAAGETSAGKMQRDIFLAGKDTGFGADQYGPQLSSIQRATESQKDFVKRLQESVKTGKLNITTLSQQRAKLDDIRNGLDPTSAAFKRATQAIATTDKALAKLNNNKFSGRNMGRTAQSILGASFFGGPAGFLGSTLGAGFEALRPGGDMAQGAVTGGLVASQVLQPIAGFGAESANYTAMIEKSKIALEAATKVEGDAIASKEAYKIALATAAGVTERFNVPQELAARGMTRLSAAVIGAGGNIHNAGIAFENISAAIKATGGSTEDTKAAVTAMVQIFSKGRVSAEELSGQLGERFPAAVTLFAEANNMTTQELQKGLKDGAIGLDKLWKFVLKLGDKYKGVAEAIGSASVEAGVRSQIAWNEVKLAVGGALQPIGADLQVVGAEILTTLVPALTKLAEITGAVLQVLSGALVGIVENLDKAIASIGAFIAATTILHGQALAALTKALILVPLQSFISSLGLAALGQKAFASATGMATAQVRIFNIAMNKNLIILGATALVAAGSAVWHFGRQWQRTVNEIEKGKMPLNDARIKVAELEKELKGESNEKLRLRLQTQIDMYKEAIETRMELVKAAELAEAESFKNASAKPDEGKWATVQEYVKELGNGGKHLQDTFINAFKGMEDAMVNFVMTGKIRFKEFARSVIADIARMIAKQMMFNMISGFMLSLIHISEPTRPY